MFNTSEKILKAKKKYAELILISIKISMFSMFSFAVLTDALPASGVGILFGFIAGISTLFFFVLCGIFLALKYDISLLEEEVNTKD